LQCSGEQVRCLDGCPLALCEVGCHCSLLIAKLFNKACACHFSLHVNDYLAMGEDKRSWWIEPTELQQQ